MSMRRDRDNVARFRSGYSNRVHTPQVISRVLRRMLDVYDEKSARTPSRFPKLQFDTLVGTGLSGSLIVPQLARSLTRHGRPVHWTIVRKSDDQSHSRYRLEGDLGHRWLFVDDLISSGKTLRRCVDSIQHVCRDAELSGIFLYSGSNAAAGDGWGSLSTARQERQKRWDSYDLEYNPTARANPDEQQWGFKRGAEIDEFDVFHPLPEKVHFEPLDVPTEYVPIGSLAA